MSTYDEMRASGMTDDEIRPVLEDQLEQRLVDLGYMERVTPPITDFSPYENRQLIKVKGKPLSEIIVEERR